MDHILNEYEKTALLGCEAVRAALAYQGSNKEYFLKGHLGSGAMSNYAKLRGTMANEAALRLAAIKIEEVATKRLIGKE